MNIGGLAIILTLILITILVFLAHLVELPIVFRASLTQLATLPSAA